MRVASLVWVPLISVFFFFPSCCKDETEEPPSAQPVDGRDRFVGSYAVYDTTGTYLYWMTVSKFGTGGRDSLLIENYADTFDLQILHESYWNQNHWDIGVFFPALDQAGYSWALSDAPAFDGSNVLTNDTIPLKFTMDNIAFYFNEGVPYYSCVCKQIAVKQ